MTEEIIAASIGTSNLTKNEMKMMARSETDFINNDICLAPLDT